MSHSSACRKGLTLFAIYLLLYGGFVGINAFSPELMKATPAFGLNVAVLYGFGLILAAIVMALLYGILGTPGTTAPERETAMDPVERAAPGGHS